MGKHCKVFCNYKSKLSVYENKRLPKTFAHFMFLRLHVVVVVIIITIIVNFVTEI